MEASGARAGELQVRREVMFCTNAIYAAWFWTLIIAAPIERAHQRRLIQQSSSIAVGMTPKDVVSVLGEPDGEYSERSGLAWLLMGPRPKQWMYGTTLNLDYLIEPELPFPNPLPVNLRITEYAVEDLVIDWSPDDVVTAVRRPRFDVPQGADAMLDTVNFVGAVLRLIVVHPQ